MTAYVWVDPLVSRMRLLASCFWPFVSLCVWFLRVAAALHERKMPWQFQKAELQESLGGNWNPLLPKFCKGNFTSAFLLRWKHLHSAIYGLAVTKLRACVCVCVCLSVWTMCGRYPQNLDLPYRMHRSTLRCQALPPSALQIMSCSDPVQ